MDEDKNFQKRVQKIGELVHELDHVADPAARAAAKGLVQSLMELHSAALERILEIIFASDAAGEPLIDRLGQDSLVSSLLVLYGLHPLDLETRVQQKLKEIRSKLFKMGAEASVVRIEGNDIRLRVRIEGHGCGSTHKTVQAAVEDAIYEAAPDLSSLAIEGLEQPAASGFVGINALVGSSVPAAAPSPHELAVRTEGMD